MQGPAYLTSVNNYPVNSNIAIRRFITNRAPGSSDYRNWIPGDEWLDSTTQQWYKFVFYSPTVGAVWNSYAPANFKGLVGNTGIGTVDNAGYVTVVGTGPITTTGTTGTLTISLTGAIPVSNGGTGKTSFNPYGIIFGGTTSTGALQSLNTVGLSGQVLTSSGSGNLPTWQTPTVGAITVDADSGTATTSGGVINLVGNSSQGVSTSATGSTVTFTVANATSATKGVSYFNSSEFTVTAGLVTSNNFTVTAGNGLSGGGVLTLGGSTTLNLSAPVSVSNGGTGTTTTFTQGSVVFAGASGVYSQDNSNFFWDATNHRLGLGTASPQSGLDVSTGIALGSYAGSNSAGTGNLIMPGKIVIGTPSVGTNPAIQISSTTAYGIQISGTGSSVDGSNASYGINFSRTFFPPGSASNLYAISLTPIYNVQSTYTASNIAGVSVSLSYTGSAGTITNAYGVRVASGGSFPGAALTNAYGIYAAHPTSGTNAYAIYADDISIGNLTPAPSRGLYCYGNAVFQAQTTISIAAFDSTRTLTSIPAGSSGQVLTCGATGTLPTWQNPSTGTTTFNADSGFATPSAGAIYLAGNSSQGVSTSATGSTVTFTVANATTTTVGVASFSSTNFSVTSGAVSSNNFTVTAGSGISGGGSLTLGGSTTLSLAATYNADSGSATTSSGAITIAGTSAQGISTSATGSTVTITAANSTYTTKGVASFSATNFAVSTGAVSCKATSVTYGTGLSGTGSIAVGGSYTINLTLPVAVTSGGTGTTTSFTQGSVVFAGASGVYSQDNANFFWDDTNYRLGLGTLSPKSGLDVTTGISMGSYAGVTGAGTGNLITPGQFSLGSSTVNTTDSLKIANNYAYAVRLTGTQTAVDASTNAFGFYNNRTYAPTGNANALYGVFVNTGFQSASTFTVNSTACVALSPLYTGSSGTINNAYGMRIGGGGLGAGTITNAYGLAVSVPTAGTNQFAIYTDNISIGTSNPPPAFGMALYGNAVLYNYPAYSVLGLDSTQTVAAIAPSTSGYVLTSNGASAVATFQDLPASGATTFAADSGTATPSAGTITIAGTSAQGISTSATGSTVTITAANATTTTKGVASFNTTNFTVTSGAVSSNALTVTAGSGLSGGGSVNLGGSVTLSLTAPVGVTSGGTGTTTSFTQGSVVFAGASGVYAQDNANFFWDATNHRLGIGTSAPKNALDVSGGIAVGSYAGVNTGPTNGLLVSGQVGFGTASPGANNAITITSALAHNVTANGTITNVDGSSRQHVYQANSTFNPTSGSSLSTSFEDNAIINIPTGQTATSVASFHSSPTFTGNAGTITTGYGFWYDGGGSLPGGTLTTSYGAFIAAPAAGTTKVPLYAAGAAIGTTGTAPPSNGLLVNGNIQNTALTASSFVLTDSSKNLISGTIPLSVGNGGTGTSTSFTQGSVVFAGASGVYAQDNSNFFWDATNHRLGIGTTAPKSSLDVSGGIAVGSYAGSNVAATGCIIISGQMAIATTSDTGISSLNLGGSSAYSVRVTGTQNGLDANNNSFGYTTPNTFSYNGNGNLYAAFDCQSTFIARTGNTFTGACGLHVKSIYTSNVGTISNIYGVYVEAGSAGAGTITNGYGGYFTVPTAATTNVGLYADNMAIGTAATAPPSNGLLVNGTIKNSALTASTVIATDSSKNLTSISSANNGVLVTSNSGVPSWLANSSTPGYVLTANSGAPPSWQATGASGGFTQINIQTFTSSGTYTPTTNMKYCIVEICGGGGGGGGVNSSSGSNISVAGGGGGGGYCRAAYSAATVGASQTVTIGSGGSGGASGGNNGSAGGNSTFGALLTANGGAAGFYGGLGSSPVQASGGAGGSASGGTVNIVGGYGSAGWGVEPSGQNGIGQGGAGGASQFSPYNPVGFAIGSGGAGANGIGYGGGGSGAFGDPSAAFAGGTGSGGICIVTEYI